MMRTQWPAVYTRLPSLKRHNTPVTLPPFSATTTPPLTTGIRWSTRATMLMQRYQVNPQHIELVSLSQTPLPQALVQPLIEDTLESMAYAEANRSIPHFSNDFLGAVLRLKSGD